GGTGTGAGAPAPQTQPQPPAQGQQPPAAGQPPVQPPGQSAPPAPPVASKPAPPTYTAVTGPFCAVTGTTVKQYGWFDDGQKGWLTNSGGYAGDGCNGKFTSVPMQGSANTDDGNSVVYTFNTGPVTSGKCALSVYVPNNGDIKAVGGAPTYYTVQSKSDPGAGTVGSFEVNQVGHRGQWVPVGTFPLSDGRIAVMLHTRGEDWGAKAYAHHAASAIKANCTG
ncbi:hypothetical protein J5Y04_22850, partial [Kitasatospora sp. RG8]|nr:hypothetical protein [Kitasatospora sp. RG8]